MQPEKNIYCFDAKVQFFSFKKKCTNNTFLNNFIHFLFIYISLTLCVLDQTQNNDEFKYAIRCARLLVACTLNTFGIIGFFKLP